MNNLPHAGNSGRGHPAPLATKKKRAELVANIQWLCRLFLETREQLFSTHIGTSTEEAVCSGLREELNVIHFRQLLEETFTVPLEQGATLKLQQFLKVFGCRALYGHRQSAYGLHAY